MAITFIYPIKVTGQNSLNYDTETKEATLEKNDSLESLNYIMKDKKGNTYELSKDYIEKMKAYVSIDQDGKMVFKTISSYLNCGKNNTYKEWQKIRDTMNQTNGNKGCLQYCIVQNFGEDLDPMLANEIGVKFAQEYLGNYQCVVSTHINTGHVHNHIEFNATSFVDGKKYNRCTEETKKIRKISDRLCDEYGLEVLEATREMKLVKFKTEDGKIVFYEPTDRKNQKKDGEYANKNDYRNTSQYDSIVMNEESHKDILKRDMDSILPYSNSYEDFLRQMENIGYEIKAKTKEGEWRKHISFKRPEWEKYIRDGILGEEYERKFIEGKFENSKENDLNKIHVQEEEIYEYGRIIIEDLDEEYRYKKKRKEDEVDRKKRSKLEKDIIIDTKNMNSEVDQIVRAALHPQKNDIKYKTNDKRKKYLIDRINANLKTLHFVEQKEIKSFDQINAIVKNLIEKRNECYKQVSVLADAIKKANSEVALIKKYQSLKKCVEHNKYNEEYVLYESQNDYSLLREYEMILKARGLLEEDKQNEFINKVEYYRSRFEKITAALEQANRDIQEYDDCVRNIGYIDRQGDNHYKDQIAHYFQQKKDLLEKHNKSEEGRN